MRFYRRSVVGEYTYALMLSSSSSFSVGFCQGRNAIVNCSLSTRFFYFFFSLSVILLNNKNADGQWAALRQCPQQCSCTLQRTYVSMSGDYDELEILCNRYAARTGANLSSVPNMTALKSNDYWIQVTMEQLEFESLSGNLFASHKVKSLKIMNNLKLKVVHPEPIASIRETLEELVVLGNQALEKFPYEVLAVLSNLKLLSLQFTKNYTRWKSPIFPHVTSLETVNLIGQGFGRYLKGLGHLKNLKQLNLAEMNVGGRKFVDKRFQFLSKLTKLTSLAMEKINLTVLPPQMEKMSQLKHLFLKSNKLMINRNWPEFAELPTNLEILDLRWNNYESFPCKVFNLTRLNNLKTDMEILCFSCRDDKTKIEQLKSSCKQNMGTNTQFRRKNFDPNNINLMNIDDIDNDSSGWEEVKSEEYDDLVNIPATTVTTKRPKSSRTTTLSTSTFRISHPISSKSRFTNSTRAIFPISTTHTSPKTYFRIPTTTTAYKMTMTTIRRSVLSKTTISKLKPTTTTSLRTDYFYEDAPDWQSEHLINPKSKNEIS